MRILYSIFMVLLTLPLSPYLWFVMRKHKLNHRFKERFGFIPQQTTDIWVHASSVGEVQASTEFCKQLAPAKVVLSTTTVTGFLHAQNNLNLEHFFFSFDLPFIWRRVLRRLKPKKLVLLERETWPNLVRECKKNKVKVFLINAKFSQKSFNKAKKIKSIILPCLNSIDKILAQSELDCQRLFLFGVEKHKCEVVGNLKFDLKPPKTTKHKLSHKLVIVAGSTRTGEDEILLKIHQTITKKYANCLLIIAPRHPKRFSEVWQLINKYDFKATKYSDAKLPQDNDAVFLLDTLGELLAFYAAGDICFVGGSLVTGIGGHNLLEPAILQKPVISGTFLSEIKHTVTLLGTALSQFSNVEEGISLISNLADNLDLAQKLGKKGFNSIEKNKGATKTCVAALKSLHN